MIRGGSMSSMKNIVLGGAHFEEDEEHFSFKFRFMFVLIVFGGLTSGLFLIGHHAHTNSMGLIHSRAQTIHVGACLLLLLLLYGRKRLFTLVAWSNAVFSFALLVSAMLFVPQDELRILWFFLSLPSVYLLLGTVVGSISTGLFILIVVGINNHMSAPYSPHAMATAIIGFIYLGCVFHAFSSRSISYFERLVESKQKLRHLSMHDALTGLLNLRAYRQACDQVVAMSLRSKAPFAILFIDLDHFKQINDTHGHEAGDAVLKSVSSCLKQKVRCSDVLGRIGGEEFAVLSPDTDLAGALNQAEKLRKAIEELNISSSGRWLKITASIGVATRTAEAASFQEIQSKADEAMYQAKQAGRNRVSTLSASHESETHSFKWEEFKTLNCQGCKLHQPETCPLPKAMALCEKGASRSSDIFNLMLPCGEDGTRRCGMVRV